jgi:transposase-like protein
MEQNGTENRRELVASALANGCSVSDAATRFDVGRTTIHRWKTESEFRDRISELRSELLSQAAGRSAALVGEALATLGELLTDPEQPGNVRVSSARVLIDSTLRITELKTLDDRLLALEQQAKDAT